MTPAPCIVALCVNQGHVEAEFGDWHLFSTRQVAIALRNNEIRHTMLSRIANFVELHASGASRIVTKDVAFDLLEEIDQSSTDPHTVALRDWAWAVTGFKAREAA